jgi:hypothetical protein
MSGASDPGISYIGRLRSLMCALLLLFPAAVHAGPKVDTVQLRNGDRLTCEILKLQQGRLSVSTDALDKVSVHWADVVALTSPREFEIVTESGDRFYGLLQASVPGEVVVSGFGGAPTSLKLLAVTGLVPIGSSMWKRMDGNLDLGFSFAQANVETRWTFNAGAVYRSRQYELSMSAASQLTAREDANKTSRHSLGIIANRILTDQVFLTAIGQVQSNEELNLDLRTVGGGGIGKTLAQSNYRRLALYTGVVYTREQFTDQPLANSAEIALGGELDFYNPGKKGATLTNGVMSYYSLSEAGRVRVELQSAWQYEFKNDFYWSLNALESFDSHPPADQKNNDFTFSLQIGWKF